MEYVYEYNSPIGMLTLASDGEALTGLWFHDQKYYGTTISDENTVEELPVFSEAVRWLDIYFSGNKPNFLPKIKLVGSDFRKKVWKILLEIPYGKTISYGSIAKMIAVSEGKERMSAQAVGGAVGHNPIGIIVPCHRVLGSDGSLTGYAGGLDRKIWLLRREGILPANG